jgi:hypothetical protein
MLRCKPCPISGLSWCISITLIRKADAEGRLIVENGLEAVRRIDYSRPVLDGPVHHGFERFFGTVCCPTTDWLYAYMEGEWKVITAGPVTAICAHRNGHVVPCRTSLSIGTTWRPDTTPNFASWQAGTVPTAVPGPELPSCRRPSPAWHSMPPTSERMSTHAAVRRRQRLYWTEKKS